MKFTSGHKKKGGRKKEVPNKVTTDIKLAFKNLVENNLDNMTEWLERIALDNPAKAMELMISISEYNIPKLARTEITGKDGDELKINIITEDEAANKIINKI